MSAIVYMVSGKGYSQEHCVLEVFIRDSYADKYHKKESKQCAMTNTSKTSENRTLSSYLKHQVQ